MAQRHDSNRQATDRHPAALRQSSPRYASLALCVLLLLAVALVFGQAVGHDFLNIDDNQCITDNPTVMRGLTVEGIRWAFAEPHVDNWVPLTWISHMLDVDLYGRAAWGHHLTNVVLHAAAAVCLLLALWQMTGRLWPSALAAALFAIHPLRAESVTWVTERKDVLSGLLFVLTLGAYAGYARRRFSLFRYLLVAALLALGLLSKPMLVTTPLVLLLLDYWPLGRITKPRPVVAPSTKPQSAVAHAKSETSGATTGRGFVPLFLEKLPLLGLSAACAALIAWAQQKAAATPEPLSAWWRFEGALWSYATYLGRLVWPADLAVLYPLPPDHWPPAKIAVAVVVLAAVTAAAIWARRTRPYLLVGWLWYLIMLGPVSGVFRFGYGAQWTANRFTYLPQIGLCIALAWWAADLARRWKITRVAALAVALSLGLAVALAATWRQASFWHDSTQLWTHTLSCTAGNGLAHYNLGNVMRHEFPDQAIVQYFAALETRSDIAQLHSKLGITLARLGRTEEAVKHYREALKIPDLAEAHLHLGLALTKLGQHGEALEHYRIAAQLEPDNADALTDLGGAWMRLRRLDLALPCLRRAVDLQPNSAEAHGALGIALARAGRIDEAAAHYRRAAEEKPDYAELRDNFGIVLDLQGRLDEAIVQYQAAARLKPDYRPGADHLADARRRRQSLAEAIAACESRLAAEPNNVAALRELAWRRATGAAESLRDGRAAVELAQRAARLSGGGRVDVLDALAAAYAEAGQFAEAVRTAEKALKLAHERGDQPMAERLQARAALYRSKRPFRETITASMP